MQFFTNDGERLNISSDGLLTVSGNADFNVTSGELDINSTGSGEQYSLRLLNADASAGNEIGIYFGPANNVAGAYIKGVSESDFTSTANRDAGLELGTRLNGSFLAPLKISADGITTFDPNAGGTLKIGGSSAHTSKIVIADNAGNGNGNCLVEGGDGTDFFTIQSNGNVAFENGKGINFGASAGSGASSSILDDYEEGSWTPVLKDADSGGNTYSGGGNWTTWANYTKIGNVVRLTGNFYALGNSGMTSGNGIFAHGVPFPANGTQVCFARISYFNNIDNTQFGPHFQINNGQTILRLLKHDDNSGANSNTPINWGHIQTQNYFGVQFTMVYTTNS